MDATAARYTVSYEVIGTDQPYKGATTSVLITNGYTVFESIRGIIAMKRGLKVENIDIQSIVKAAS